MPYRKASVRAYRSEDEPLLYGLAERSFGGRSGWDEARTLTVLERETVFVAELGDTPAGYVALDPQGEVVRIDQLLVAPEHEGEGVGHQLVEWAEGYAISCGARALRIVVEEDNARALEFYRRAGFVQVEPGLLELILPHDEL
jgi:ribosomal protein S18 acetylase RimI-like enzyme